MLTTVLPYERTEARSHQRYEYMNLMGVGDCEVPPTLLKLPDEAVQSANKALDTESGPVIGICPGARYGPAKRWPAAHFAAAAAKIVEKTGYRVAVFGAESEADACAEVVANCNEPILNLCGKTSLSEFAAMLSLCKAVIANDSGSMHIAAAVGTPVVALFGITDSSITGPMGSNHRVIRAKGVDTGRDLERDSIQAREALASISPDEVFSALHDVLQRK
jgi:heptosyltransferase-2